MTVIAQAQGVHPLYAGTDEPIGVDAAGTRWAIAFQGRNAILTATFAAGVSLEFKIPTTNTGGSKSGSVAAFTIPNFGEAQWVTYAEHVKFEVRFPNGAPKVNTVSVNVARLSADLVSDGAGGLDVMSGGVKVGALPRPWIDYTPDGSPVDEFGNKQRTRLWLDWVVAEPTMTLTLPTLTTSEWQSAVLDPTVVTTSTAGTATAYSNQRKVDRCQNGVLWATYWGGGSALELRYSQDDGATWSSGGSLSFSGAGTTYTPNASLFIALDPATGNEILTVVYKDRHSGHIMFRGATFNAARTALTWATVTAVVNNSTAYDSPTLIGFYDGGWRAHVIMSAMSGAANYAAYCPLSVAADGRGSMTASVSLIGGDYAAGAHTWPDIDFNHTGDGKTVAGGTPDLVAQWSAGATGAGKGIRYKKAAYSGGSWTWGTEREIDSASFANSGLISSIFDGTRSVVVYADSASTGSIKVRERDAADTTTTTRTPPALSDGTVIGLSVAHDTSGNLYLVAAGATSADVKVVKYDRTAGTWGAWETLATTTAQTATVTAARLADAALRVLYTSGTSSPYNVEYTSLSTVTDQHESGGATATVAAQATGAGTPAESAAAGASATVNVATTGAGTAAEHLSAGAVASINTTTTGAGQATEAATAGATATVNALATGAGTAAEAASSAATSTITVTATGGGNAATETSAGATATASVAATGGGVAREHAQGGTGATVTVVATGGTTEPQAETGGATATVQIVAYTGAAAAEHASIGATATVTVHTTGRNPDAPPDIPAGVARATIRPNTARASIRTQKATATIRPNTAKAVIR